MGQTGIAIETTDGGVCFSKEGTKLIRKNACLTLGILTLQNFTALNTQLQYGHVSKFSIPGAHGSDTKERPRKDVIKVGPGCLICLNKSLISGGCIQFGVQVGLFRRNPHGVYSFPWVSLFNRAKRTKSSCKCLCKYGPRPLTWRIWLILALHVLQL